MLLLLLHAFQLYLCAVLQTNPHLLCLCYEPAEALLLVQAQPQVSSPCQTARPTIQTQHEATYIPAAFSQLKVQAEQIY